MFFVQFMFISVLETTFFANNPGGLQSHLCSLRSRGQFPRSIDVKCHFSNVTAPFTFMDCWEKGGCQIFADDPLPLLQARMSRNCRFLLFLPHT